jgi:porin
VRSSSPRPANAINQDKGAKGPPLAYKFGGWYHSSTQFQDQRYATDGLLLADPASTGIPLDHAGNWASTAWWTPRSISNNLSGFVRIGAGTPGDRNLASFYADAGLTMAD